MPALFNCTGYEDSGITIVRGEGASLYDDNGKEYLDFESGVWCAGLGHGCRRVDEAALRQIGRIAHIGYRFSTPELEGAACAVLDAAGMAEGKALFLGSGSEAVEFGVQAARRISGKPLLLAFSGAYLSAYGSAGNLADSREWYIFDWSGCDACVRGSSVRDSGKGGIDCRGCPRFQEIPFDRIGGFVFEPGNSHGCVRIPPVPPVRAAAAETASREGLLVIDEVTTGFCRTGKWFGFQWYGLSPDIVAMAKGAGNGYPVSVVALGPEAASSLEKNGFRYAQSHQNDPLGAAIVREVISEMREKEIPGRVLAVGETLILGLREIAARYPLVREVRGRGLMVAVELAPGPAAPAESAGQGGPAAPGEQGGRTQQTAPPPVLLAQRELLERGYVVGCRPGDNLLRFYPPLVITERHIRGLLEALDEVLAGIVPAPASGYNEAPISGKRKER